MVTIAVTTTTTESVEQVSWSDFRAKIVGPDLRAAVVAAVVVIDAALVAAAMISPSQIRY